MKKWTGAKRTARIVRDGAQSRTANQNAEFVLARRKFMGNLRKALRQGQVDSPIITIARKFARLPFAYIDISCGGHFYRRKGKSREANAVSIEELNSMNDRKTLYFNGAHFEVKFNDSPQSSDLRKAIEKLRQRFPALLVTGESELTIWMKLHSAHNPVTKKRALDYQRTNLTFLRSFEQVVDSFVKKYGVRMRL